MAMAGHICARGWGIGVRHKGNARFHMSIPTGARQGGGHTQTDICTGRMAWASLIPRNGLLTHGIVEGFRLGHDRRPPPHTPAAAAMTRSPPVRPSGDANHHANLQMAPSGTPSPNRPRPVVPASLHSACLRCVIVCPRPIHRRSGLALAPSELDVCGVTTGCPNNAAPIIRTVNET